MTYRVEVKVWRGWVKSRHRHLSEDEANEIASSLVVSPDPGDDAKIGQRVGLYFDVRVVPEETS